MAIRRRGKAGTWHHYKRVPKRYESYDPRGIVLTSLHTTDQAEAREKAARMERLMLSRWEAMRAGHDDDAHRYHDALREIAEARGMVYLPAAELRKRPVTETLERIEAGAGDPQALEATLGAAEAPVLRMSDLFTRYEALTEDRHTGKSADQLRRWRAPRLKAVRNFTELAGNLPLRDVGKPHVHRLRSWWWERVKAGTVSAGSANKDFSYLSAMFSTVAKMDGLHLDNPFRDIALQEKEAEKFPFSTAWIRERILAAGALAELNSEAADILLVMVNTGCRPSEVCDLLPEHIHLDANIPHFEIRPDGRELKTSYSRRDVPLVGVSLEALRRHPEGFPRYRGKPSNWSAMANKFLRGHGLLETEKHSAYSLRHAFSDRLIAAGCEDRVRKELMGHRPEGVVYGNGAALDLRASWCARVAVG